MDFKGKNNLKTARLAYERANYKLNALDEREHITDFNFAEMSFYGRVNRELEPVYANEQFIVPMSAGSGGTTTHRCMNFVNDQFKDLELHFSKACRMGVIPIDDPVFSSLKISRSYESPLEKYKTYSRSMMRSVLDNFILQNNNLVNNHEQFISLFMEFYMHHDNSETPIFSDFMKSKNSNIFMSGLALDVANVPFSDDSQKQEKLLKSPAFNYFLSLAKQYGFHVHKNNPGVIISDLQSPVTAEYRSKYLLPTIAQVFNAQYNKTIYNDLQLLENLLIESFNTYVNLNPYNSHYKSCNNNTIIETINLNYITTINYNIILLLYINMKNFFEGSPFSKSELESMKKTASTISKYDKNKTIMFIEDQFKRFYNQKDGSLTFYLKRMKKT